MRTPRIIIAALVTLALASAAFGSLGYFYKANPTFLTNRIGTGDRGYAILVADGDLTLGVEAYKRVPY